MDEVCEKSSDNLETYLVTCNRMKQEDKDLNSSASDLAEEKRDMGIYEVLSQFYKSDKTKEDAFLVVHLLCNKLKEAENSIRVLERSKYFEKCRCNESDKGVLEK